MDTNTRMPMQNRKRAPSVRTWFPDEIEAALAAVAEANGDLANEIDTPEMRLYQRGFFAALRSLAVMLQVDAPAERR